ncbi:hypothetical protein bcgnr5406_21550 [Bacillus cereus]
MVQKVAQEIVREMITTDHLTSQVIKKVVQNKVSKDVAVKSLLFKKSRKSLRLFFVFIQRCRYKYKGDEKVQFLKFHLPY